ncbi:MAG: hypothetical protein ACYC0C_01590 [Devosia sp.]
MRAGLTVSTIAHAGLIVLIIVGVGMTKPLEPTPVESIAVDLVTIEEFANIRAGTLDSKIIETETPSVVEDDTPAELAQPTGNTEQDQPTPEDTPTPTPAPTRQTAPEPVPQPEPVEEPVPEPVPEPAVQPEPQPEPEPIPEPEPAPVEQEPALATPQVSPEPAEVAPQPVMRTASLDQKRADFKKQQEAEKKRKEEEAKKKKEEERIKEAKRQEDEAARLADDISDIINAEESRGATTGEGGTPTVGKPTGQAARLSQSETDALVAQMRRCWNLLPAEIDSGLSVRLLVELNRDGSVSGSPQVLEQDGSATGISIARQAVTAVRKCGPYQLAAEKYEDWRQVDVTFRANDL